MDAVNLPFQRFPEARAPTSMPLVIVSPALIQRVSIDTEVADASRMKRSGTARIGDDRGQTGDWMVPSRRMSQ